MTVTDTTQLEQAVMTLASSIACLAESMDHLAAGAQALRLPAAAPSGPPMSSGPPQGSQSRTGGSGDSTQLKMSKKIFAICAQNGWDIGEIGERASGRNLGNDSRKWSEQDLRTVLDALKDWGFA